MINSERSILLREREIKPNRYAELVLVFLFFGMGFCWALNELGIFRVGKMEMRIGTFVPIILSVILIAVLNLNKRLLESPKTKWFFAIVAFIITLSVNSLLNFHTTMMLLFPIFFGMLYRSRAFGVCAAISSAFCTIASPLLGYVLHTWDVPLLEELINIVTGETLDITVVAAVNASGIIRTLLYLVLPRLVMIASCSLLMFYIIREGERNIQNQILLDRLNRRDTLTGAYNQNYYQQILDSMEKKGKIAVIFFDVNALKYANDNFGHESGDEFLIRAAKSLLEVCNDNDTSAFRLGGDEFLIMIENADEATANAKIEEWKLALERINADESYPSYGIDCTMAYGYAVGDFVNLANLVKAADSAMYKNKKATR